MASKVVPIQPPLTTALISEASDKVIPNYDHGRAHDVQYEDELYAVRHLSACPLMKKETSTVEDIDPDKIKLYTRDDFYDANVMKAAMCVTDSIFLMDESPATSAKIRKWITDLKQIGAESVEGVALRANFGDAKDMFIIKGPRDPKSTDLVHELFVGLNLNKLREFIPNFAYVFGGFKCSPPEITNDKKVAHWCEDTGSYVNYIVYENIAPAVPMKQYVATATFDQFLNKYLQILYAIDIAHNKMDFTHYDLHYENVLIREVEKHAGPFCIKYGNEYLETDAVATIIDYGFSHIQKDGKHYGIYGMEKYGVMSDRSYPLHDAYKILCFSMYEMMNKSNTDTFEKASKILKFFNSTEDATTAIEKQRNDVYNVPYLEYVAKYTVSDLIEYIKSIFEIPFITLTPTADVLSCNGHNMCFTVDGALKEFKSEEWNIFTLYEHISNHPENVNNLRPVFRRLRREAYDAYAKYFKKVWEDIMSFEFQNINNLPLSNLLDRNLLENFKQSVNKLIDIIDEVQELKNISDILLFCARAYNDNDLHNAVSVIIDQINEVIVRFIDPVVKSIQNIRIYLYNLYQSNREKVESIMANFNVFSWWWNGMGYFDHVQVSS